MKECMDKAADYQQFLKVKNQPVGNASKPRVLAIDNDSQQLEELVVNVMKKFFN